MFTKRPMTAMPADATTATGGGSQDYGGFWIRFLAYLADLAIITLVLAVLIVPVVFLGSAAVTLYGALCFFGPFLYFAWMQSSARQASFGKDLLGLKIAHAATGNRVSFVRSLLREIAKILSGLILALGFIMAAFTRRKQGLHDMLAGTVVTREKSPRVVAAVLLIVAGILIPFVALPLMMGAVLGGVLLAVMGPLLGGMMGAQQPSDAGKSARPVPPVSQPAAKAPPRPVPPAATAERPAAGTAMGEAEYDKQLSRPLSGIDKPSSARAGPGIVHLDTHFTDSFWLRVLLPPVANHDRARVMVTIDRVLDAKGADRYDRDSSFEKEFFRRVSLSEAGSNIPHLTGTRSVRIMKGTTEQDVRKVEGKLHLALPLDLKLVSLDAKDAGKELAAGPAKITLKSFEGNKVSFSVSGAQENFLGTKGYDAQGAVVPTTSTSHSGDQYTVSYRAPVVRIETAVASGLLARDYPFSVTRGETGGAVAPAVATASVPAKVEAKPAPAQPVPVKPAPAEKPASVEIKPAAPAKPGATPDKLAAVTLAQAKPAPVEAKPAAVAIRPAPPPSAAVPASSDKPKARRAAKPKPAAAEPTAPAVPVPPARTAKYNDVMTAVMNRDAAGVAEVLELGIWADRPDSNGVTPLMAAAMLGDAGIAQLLVRNGANLNARGPGGSVLDYAQRSRNDKTIAVLKQAGAR